MHIALTDGRKASYLKKELCHMLVHKCLLTKLYFFLICLIIVHEDHICPVDFIHGDTPF